jgi:TonB family protein
MSDDRHRSGNLHASRLTFTGMSAPTISSRFEARLTVSCCGKRERLGVKTDGSRCGGNAVHRSLVIAAALLGAQALVGAAASQEPQKPPSHVVGQIGRPTKTKDAKPVYPPEARSAHVQGVVIIEATISPTGTVQDARVLRSIPLLDAAALDAVRQWEFTPTLVNGVPTPVKMTLTVMFWLPFTVSEATGPDGAKQVFEITSERAALLPRWDQNITPEPPLSASDARRAGERWLKVRNPHVQRFELVSLSLLQRGSETVSTQCGGTTGCWHYRLTFEPMDGERHLPSGPDYIAIVLLDGTIVEPRIERASTPRR